MPIELFDTLQESFKSLLVDVNLCYIGCNVVAASSFMPVLAKRGSGIDELMVNFLNSHLKKWLYFNDAQRHFVAKVGKCV